MAARHWACAVGVEAWAHIAQAAVLDAPLGLVGPVPAELTFMKLMFVGSVNLVGSEAHNLLCQIL